MNTPSHNPRPVLPIPYTIMSTVKATPIPWLWKPYIPKGATSMIIGDGGYGKSYMTCAIAADLSAGRPLPGQKKGKDPQKILMISAEDGIAPVFKPRLDALQANMDNIAVYDEGFTVNPEMTKRVLAAVREFDAAIVFFDPMVVYMGGEVDSFKANEVRSILTQLNSIAKQENIAIVGVHHVKKSGGDGQHRANGSVDFANGVRSMLLVDVTKTGQYYMKHVKSNWHKKGGTLAYNFNEDRFTWQGEFEARDEAEVSRTPRGKAKAFLIATLKDGPVPSLDVLRMAKEEGLTEITIRRAKKGVCHSREIENKWYFELEPEAIPHPTITTDIVQALETAPPLMQVTHPEPEVDRLIREAREKMNG